MKLMTLNTWGGIAGDVLVDFIAAKQSEIDIFCFQEVFNGGQNEPSEIHESAKGKQYDLWTKLQLALPNHVGYFRPSLGYWYGLATFVRKDLAVIGEDIHAIHGQPGTIPEGDLGNHARILQDVTIERVGEPLHIINIHGLWNGQGKTDCPERLEQSQKILEYLRHLTGEVILCGDFNLLPSTQSLKMLEGAGLENLITQFGITSTRTARYTKPEKYADYVLVSSGVTAESLLVLPDDVSDHAALVLDFS